MSDEYHDDYVEVIGVCDDPLMQSLENVTYGLRSIRDTMRIWEYEEDLEAPDGLLSELSGTAHELVACLTTLTAAVAAEVNHV